MWDDYYNKLYSEDFTEEFYACSINCEMCRLWREPGNTWKIFIFFPFHCHVCEEGGFPNDFYLIMRKVFICYDCYKIFRRRMNYILHRIRPSMYFIDNTEYNNG